MIKEIICRQVIATNVDICSYRISNENAGLPVWELPFNKQITSNTSLIYVVQQPADNSIYGSKSLTF